jgi:glycosyltransferase involved in cell wall biosynthesis
MARVSVVVSHFDRQNLLAEALESIATQTYRDFEVIVVNDHGADSSAQVETFAERVRAGASPFTVRYDYRPSNVGVAGTRNRGIALAHGELIAYLDDDDLWRPDHLEGLVGVLDARRDCRLAYGDAEIWRMACGPGENGHSSTTPVAVRTLAVPFHDDALRRDDFIVPGGMIHLRSLYDDVGPYDESLFVSDDWDWLIRASAITHFVRLPRVIVTVRIWADGANLSASEDPRRLAALREIERRHNTPPLEPKTFWEVAETYGKGVRA